MKKKESRQNLTVITTKEWLDSTDKHVSISEWCLNRKKAQENRKKISKQDEKKQKFWQKEEFW